MPQFKASARPLVLYSLDNFQFEGLSQTQAQSGPAQLRSRTLGSAGWAGLGWAKGGPVESGPRFTAKRLLFPDKAVYWICAFAAGVSRDGNAVSRKEASGGEGGGC